MFKLAFLIGFFPFIVFFTGTIGFLNKEIILYIVNFYLFLSFLVFKNNIFHLLIRNIEKINIGKLLTTVRNNKLNTFLVALIIIQAGINLVGALGPELGFDALWYHLTIPKIYLHSGKIFYLGGHLYYSAMPQLTEMFYLVSIALGNEVIAKIIHFLFGILSLIAIYKLSRIFFPVRESIIAVLIFYSNLVVGWMSITAYIDLARTFFEVMALWAFISFVNTNRIKWLCISASMIGFAASIKILSIGSFFIYLLLLSYLKFYQRIKLRRLMKLLLIYTGIFLTIISPWLIFSYIYTNSPLYPFFSPGFQQPLPTINLIHLLKQTFQIFLLSPDPISPIYAISLPLIGMFIIKLAFRIAPRLSVIGTLLVIYIFLGVALLFFTPVESSGRFILPYLPAFTLIFLLLIRKLKSKLLYNLLFAAILLVAVSSILYRGAANKRFLTYLLGRENLSQFMANNMEFQVGNFFDTDGFFQKTIKPTDKVLIYGISNLYYVNFPYISETWVKKGDKFNYVLVKNTVLPDKFKDWRIIYQNPLTKVRLYSLNHSWTSY